MLRATNRDLSTQLVKLTEELQSITRTDTQVMCTTALLPESSVC